MGFERVEGRETVKNVTVNFRFNIMIRFISLRSNVIHGWRYRPGTDGGLVDCACFGVVSGLEIAATLISLGLAVWWLVVRHTADYAWVLQVIRRLQTPVNGLVFSDGSAVTVYQFS